MSSLPLNHGSRAFDSIRGRHGYVLTFENVSNAQWIGSKVGLSPPNIPVKGTAAIQRAATVVASPNFVATLADNFAFEVNIGVSRVRHEHVAHRTREPLS